MRDYEFHIHLLNLKENGAKRISDYRLISLVTGPYKIIYKVLSNRLKNILHAVIDENQFAFLRAKNIFDSVLIANQCLEEYRWKQKKGEVVKLDLEKAYDKSDWEFLDFVLERKGFKL